MSEPIREAYDARRLLMQRLNAILDDRWPLAGKIMAAVDEYAEARSTPAEALDVLRVRQTVADVTGYTFNDKAWDDIAARLRSPESDPA